MFEQLLSLKEKVLTVLVLICL